MSINNLWIEPGRALVGVDSEGRDEQGKIHQVSKMLPLVHQNAVLCGSGTLPFANTLWGSCHVVGGNLDELIERLPQLLAFAYRLMVGTAAINGISLGPRPEKQSCILCGWSPLRARMVAVMGQQTDEAAGFAVNELPYGGYLQPWIDDEAWGQRFAGLPVPNTPAAMGCHAQEQARAISELIPEIHGGGKFIVAELGRERMTIAPACDLP